MRIHFLTSPCPKSPLFSLIFNEKPTKTKVSKWVFGQTLTKSFFLFGMIFAVASMHAALIIKPDGTSVPTLSAANALNTPLGVRAYGMGMAQTGAATDLSSLYYNPAGLGSMNYFEYALSYQSMPNDVNGHSFMASIPLPYGAMGISGVFNTVSDSQYIDKGINTLPDRNKYSYITTLSYGAPILSRKLNAGMNVKWFSANFLDSPAVTAYPQQQKGMFIDLALLGMFDPGHYWESWNHWPKLSAGFAARNLHPLFKLDNEVSSSENRAEYNVGATMHFKYKLNISADIVNSPSFVTRFRYGLEYWPAHFLALRTGFTHAAEGNAFKSIHWGIGLGEVVQASKLSFEYAGGKDYPTGFGIAFESDHATYHRFAFHHSFESIEQTNDRKTPIRFTERYSHRYRFARELSPREIIDDTVTALNPEEAGYDPSFNAATQPTTGVEIAPTTEGGSQPPEAPTPPGQKPKPKPTKPEQIVGKFIVAVFPVSVEVTTGKNKNPTLKEKLRGNFLVSVNKNGAGRLVNAVKFNAAPKRDEGESENIYMKRLLTAMGVDLIVFSKLYMDTVSGELKLVNVYYKKDDKMISGLTEVKGSDGDIDTFVARSTESFTTQHKALLAELK